IALVPAAATIVARCRYDTVTWSHDDHWAIVWREKGAMVEKIDCALIGAGVVGLAAARALAMAGREGVVLDPAEAFGTGTSARNSEVIHAGLYYLTGSLKARLCVEGNRKLVDYCRERGVDHALVGKLIVATDDVEAAKLETLLATATANGVPLQSLS